MSAELDSPLHGHPREPSQARTYPFEPVFELLVRLPERELEARLTHHFRMSAAACIGWVTPPYAELHVPEAQRHFWSPRLALTFDEHPEGTIVHGVYRPEPDVFTGFMFGHTAFVSLALAGFFVGVAQVTLGQLAWALIGLPIGLLLSGLLIVAAKLGQKLGRDEMRMLRRELDQALAQTSAS